MSTTPSSPSPEPVRHRESDEEPSTAERLRWMRKSSGRLILTLVVLVVAGIVVAFSFSLFSSSSANPGNLAATGIMQQSNSQDGQAVLTVEKLLPGSTGTGTVTVANVGDAAGDFRLTASGLVDDPADPPLSQVLNLTITDGGEQVYTGALGSVGTIDLGTWAGGESHDFAFTVTFAQSAGNEYQDAKTSVDFTWDATQSTS